MVDPDVLRAIALVKRKKPVSSKFWMMEPTGSDSQLARWHPDMRFEAHTPCPVTSEHHSSRRVPELKVVLMGKSVFRHFNWTWYHECLVRRDLADALEASGLTGFQLKPVEATLKNGQPPEQRLFEFTATGWGGITPGARLLQDCAGCGWRRYDSIRPTGFTIDETQWNGTDFFIVWPLPMHIFVTQRVVNFVKEHRFSGVKFLPLVELDFQMGFTVGCLDDYMDEPFARNFGEPLALHS